MAFLVNLLAYPFVLGLLPYVAKEVYGAGQAGLGYLAAAFWSGALVGSLCVGAGRFRLRAARTMLWSARPVVRRDRCSSARRSTLAARPRAALRRRLRAELLPHAARRGHAALLRRGDARPRDGRAHARDLGTAARPARRRAAHRRRRLRGDHPALLPASASPRPWRSPTAGAPRSGIARRRRTSPDRLTPTRWWRAAWRRCRR